MASYLAESQRAIQYRHKQLRQSTTTFWQLIWEMLMQYITEHEDILTPVCAGLLYLQPRSFTEIYHKVMSAVTSCCMCTICKMIAGAFYSTKWCGEMNSGMKVISICLEILENLKERWNNFTFTLKATTLVPLNKPCQTCQSTAGSRLKIKLIEHSRYL